jgi:hypothetical protein
MRHEDARRAAPGGKGDDDMMLSGKKKKVLCPIQAKDGKTYWRQLGAGFVNKDGESITIYLDSFPVNGKLFVCEWESDEKYAERRSGAKSGYVEPAPASEDLPF